MTSKKAPDEAFVWAFLPNRTEPVVAGRIERDGTRYVFNYGRSYLKRKEAIALYEPELPLQLGAMPPLNGLSIAGCLRDGAPDAWGRRVIINRMFGKKGDDIDVDALDEITYLLGRFGTGRSSRSRRPTTSARNPDGAAGQSGHGHHGEQTREHARDVP